MSKIFEFPQQFISMWNHSAGDSVIDVNEMASLRSIVSQTSSKDDEEFIGELDALTKRRAKDFSGETLLDLCSLQKLAENGGLRIKNITVYLSDREGDKRNIFFGRAENMCEVKISSEQGYNSWEDTSSGFRDIDLGYQYSTWNGGGHSQGVHVGVPYALWKNPYISLTAETQANVLFGGFALTGGAGPGLHIGYYDVVEAYGKLMLNGHVTTGDIDKTTGWSANAVAGIKILFLYGEMIFSITGSGFQQEGLFSAGLRGTFGGDSYSSSSSSASFVP